MSCPDDLVRGQVGNLPSTDQGDPETAYEIKGREQQEAGAMLMGRVSSDEFAPVWPTMDEFAEYIAMPKYVVSTTLTDPTWHNTQVFRSLADPAAGKTKLELVEHASYSNGVRLAVYDVAR